LRAECAARAESFLYNSGNDKRSAAENFSTRTADCDNAIRPRFLNHDKLVAIRFRAARFGVGRLAIARANAPARAEGSDQSRPSRTGGKQKRN